MGAKILKMRSPNPERTKALIRGEVKVSIGKGVFNSRGGWKKDIGGVSVHHENFLGESSLGRKRNIATKSTQGGTKRAPKPQTKKPSNKSEEGKSPQVNPKGRP